MFRKVLKIFLFVALVLSLGQMRVKSSTLGAYFIAVIGATWDLGIGETTRLMQKAGLEWPKLPRFP